MAYQVNFCETKEQLKHLAEVVTGKDDGSPTGADIDTSTLAYAGLVRDTLPELLSKLGWYSVGEWSTDPLISNDNQYVLYNGVRYVPISIPYQVNSTANPDPELLVGSELKVITDVTDSDLTRSQGEMLPAGSQIYPEVGVLQNGDTVQAGTTHLRVFVGGEPTIVAMSPIASGAVSSLSSESATIGGNKVSLVPVTSYAKSSEKLFKPLRYTTEQLKSLLGSSRDSVIEINSGNSLAYIELIAPSTDLTQTEVVFDFDLLGGIHGVDFTFNVALMDDLDRTNQNSISGLTVNIERNVATVSISSTPTQQDFIAWSIRALTSQAAKIKLKSATVYESGVKVGELDVNILPRRDTWSNSLSEVDDGVVKQRIGIPTGQGEIHNVGYVPISPSGSSSLGMPPYSLEFYLDNLYSGNNILTTLGLGKGIYTQYRRRYFIDAIKDINLIAIGGKANIMCGTELPTSSWSVDQTSPLVEVRSAPYDPSNHWDVNVRNNTSQPYLSALVPESKTRSVKNYAFQRASSISEVRSLPNRSYFDGTNVYFSFPTTQTGFADTCFVYVSECDAGIRYPSPSSPSNVNAFNVHIYASRRWNWRLRPSSLGDEYVSLHSCGAYASSTDQGYSVDFINGELVDCIGDSNFGDDFNFHDEGHTILIRPQSYHSGDDGISHHENCTGYIEDPIVKYPSAAYSVPAFGARVLQIGGVGVPATEGLSGKPYQSSWAVLGGSSGDSYACYIGAISYGDNDFSCISQGTGKASIELSKPTTKDGKLKILATGPDTSVFFSQ